MKLIRFGLLVTLIAFLVACGGGGAVPDVSDRDEKSALTITGVAATGAAFNDAVVSVIDSRGVSVGVPTTVNADGSYSVLLDADAVAPFVLIATRTDANGGVEQLVSVVASASSTVANITPITTLMASRLSPSGNPAALASELAEGTATIDPSTVADVIVEVRAMLLTLLEATGTENTDPLTGTFVTDGSGYDRLLDSIKITFLPESATSTNIEVAVRRQLEDEEAPTAQTFNSSDTTVPPLPAFNPDTLVADGTALLIDTFLQELTACYALTLEQRVNGTVDPDEPNNRMGDAQAVSAPACRNLFSEKNPGNFLSGGLRVGRTDDNRGAFASLFRGGATGFVASQGTYEFTLENGDIVIGYKGRDAQGNEDFDTFVLRKDGDGKLRLIGNQYRFPGSVQAFQQSRQFITLDQGDLNYYSTGYTLFVPNVQRNAGGNLFDRVVVTTPSGRSLTLKSSAGASYMVLVKPTDPEVLTNSNFVRLRTEYADGNAERPHPRTAETSLFFALPERTEKELADTKSQGTWKFEYFTTVDVLGLDDLPNGVDEREVPVVQYYKSRARALTIGELRTKGLAELTPEFVKELQTYARTAAQPVPGQIVFEGDESADIDTEGGGDGWRVAAGQLPPRVVEIYGRSPNRVFFNDSVNVRSTTRKVTVPCTPQGIADDHCVSDGLFAQGSVVNGLQLIARDAVGREYGSFYGLYKLGLAGVVQAPGEAPGAAPAGSPQQ